MLAPAISTGFTLDAAVVAGLGGAVLGVTVAFKTGTAGGVVGIAGITRGFMVKPCVRKAAFVVGLVVAGALMSATYGGVPSIPHAGITAEERLELFVRFATGGFLVGLGTAMANGCTSGHGLTGLARLSLRSWVAVPVFMLFAAITATLAGTSKVFPEGADFVEPTASDAAVWSGAAVAVVLLALGASLLGRAGLSAELAAKVKPIAELVSGLGFGCGLAISSMLRPSKVAGFLDLGSGAWDPSLAFVMGGGLMMTFPFFQIMERAGPSSPLLGGAFDLPPKSKMPDRQLVLGSAVFGVGWGICGVCPGPIWVLVGAEPSAEVAVVLVCMLSGMGTWILYQKYDAAARRRRASNPLDASATATTTTNDAADKIDEAATMAAAAEAGEAVPEKVDTDSGAAPTETPEGSTAGSSGP